MRIVAIQCKRCIACQEGVQQYSQTPYRREHRSCLGNGIRRSLTDIARFIVFLSRENLWCSIFLGKTWRHQQAVLRPLLFGKAEVDDT